MSQSIDHRWGDRLDCRMAVELRSPGGGCVKAMLSNVSLSGALVETRDDLPLMEQVSVRPLAPTAHWRRAFVVRNLDGAMALEWFEPGHEAIRAFMPSHRAEQPLSMHRTIPYQQHHALAG